MPILDALPLAALIWSAMNASVQAENKEWPVVAPVHSRQTFTTRQENEDKPFFMTVKDNGGRPIYQIECHSGEYEDQSVMNFSGTFHCALFGVSGKTRTTLNLLATTDEMGRRSDWDNRGRMLSEQLRGQCAGYPEYGRLRHFRLRSMLVTFRFSELRWFPFEAFGHHRLRSFTYEVSVVSDPGAVSGESEPVAAKQPRRSCGW